MLPVDLGDRLLWADGVSTVTPERATELLLRGHPVEKLAVTEVTAAVKRFNELSEVPLTVKKGVNMALFPPGWVLPDGYKYSDLDDHLIKLADRVERDELYEKRMQRLADEIALFKKHGLDEVLRSLIYVVDTLRASNSVWGVGRGSSCSSYLLFLLGLHAVDAVRFDVEITDFIRSESA